MAVRIAAYATSPGERKPCSWRRFSRHKSLRLFRRRRMPPRRGGARGDSAPPSSSARFVDEFVLVTSASEWFSARYAISPSCTLPPRLPTGESEIRGDAPLMCVRMATGCLEKTSKRDPEPPPAAIRKRHISSFPARCASSSGVFPQLSVAFTSTHTFVTRCRATRSAPPEAAACSADEPDALTHCTEVSSRPYSSTHPSTDCRSSALATSSMSATPFTFFTSTRVTSAPPCPDPRSSSSSISKPTGLLGDAARSGESSAACRDSYSRSEREGARCVLIGVADASASSSSSRCEMLTRARRFVTDSAPKSPKGGLAPSSEAFGLSVCTVEGRGGRASVETLAAGTSTTTPPTPTESLRFSVPRTTEGPSSLSWLPSSLPGVPGVLEPSALLSFRNVVAIPPASLCRTVDCRVGAERDF